MTRRHYDLQAFTDVFTDDFGGLLSNVPEWSRRAIGRSIQRGSVSIVSAVCPDYERKNGAFTYGALGTGLPFTATEHLRIVETIANRLVERGVRVSYSMTLADTEFDLPLVVGALAGGSPDEFLQRCQQSCNALMNEARRRDVPLQSCARFTDVFPQWFDLYREALEHLRTQAAQDRSIGYDLAVNAVGRVPLYQAMAGRPVSTEYCREMVLRQWAQYAAWGECATQKFGDGFVMMNHSTPNLSCVNHPLFRAGRQRIPIIQLSITTMPG